MKNGSGAGFTLLEIIVVVSIIGLMGLLIAQVFFATTRANTKTELLKDIKQNGDFSMNLIGRMLRSSAKVTTTCAETGTAVTALTLTNPDGGSTTLGCALDGTVTRIASTSGTRTDYLTSSNLTLGGADCAGSSFRFVCTTLPDQATSVTIQFSLTQKGAPVDQFEKATTSFQSTVILRN